MPERFKVLFLLIGCGLVSLGRALGQGDEVTAVCSRVSDGYVRSKPRTGSFEPETYAFGEGGHLGGPMRDDTIDKLKFVDVARSIAGPLASQNYLPAKDPEKTKLLIMVYWGTTEGTADTVAHSFYYQNLNDKFSRGLWEMALTENNLRALADMQNARLLGYDSTGMIGTDYGRGLEMTALRFRVHDLIDEIEDNRYFVVLLAYDFQLLWKQKTHKLLWETRFSIRQRHHDFDKQMAAMELDASKYFGQDSHGLIRERLRDTNVTIGQPEVLQYEPEKGK
ncbi:MAG TPA: hypothetical protein VLW52_11815 [Opitutaceae bacterium]|nr:hypothetical protein [Opitutaceae bacterium]